MNEQTGVWPENIVEHYGTYETIREALSPEYYDLSNEEIEALVEDVLEGMSPDEIEGFWKTVGSIGKSVGKVAAKALPIAAPIIGTAFGGPIGTAIGGTLGQLGGKALGAAVGAGRPAPGKAGAAGMIPGGSSATAQLMSFIQNPALLKSMLGQLLGPAGRTSVPVGKQGAPAPFGAFMTALNGLANQASVEANAMESGQETPGYLLTEEGEFRCDPAVPDQRGRVLVEQLREEYFAETDDEQEDDLTEWLMESGLVEQSPYYRRRVRRRHPRARYSRHR